MGKDARFKGKVALVTGAGRGIGKETALALARDGAILAINDLNEESVQKVVDEIVAAGGQARAWACDVSDEAAVQAVVKDVVAIFGTIHILVNNAGITHPTSPLEAISAKEWDLVMRVNVNGVFYCTKAVIPYMREQQYGKIVNVASLAGRSVSNFGGAHYTTSKAAVLGLTRHTAREYASYNINVNAVAPGSLDTEMVREKATPEHMARVAASIPFGRLGTAQEVAYLIAFLASEEASYITGATFDINGGALLS